MWGYDRGAIYKPNEINRSIELEYGSRIEFEQDDYNAWIVTYGKMGDCQYLLPSLAEIKEHVFSFNVNEDGLDAVSVPDTNLKAALNKEISSSRPYDQNIFEFELKTLNETLKGRSLNLEGLGISNLEGIQYI